MPYFTRVWNDFREFTWFCSWRGTSELVMESLSPCVILDLTPIWYGMDHPVVLSDCFSRWSTDHGALESMFFIHGSWWWPQLGVWCEEYYFPCNINLEWCRLVQFWPPGIIFTPCPELVNFCYIPFWRNFLSWTFPPGGRVGKRCPRLYWVFWYHPRLDRS